MHFTENWLYCQEEKIIIKTVVYTCCTHIHGIYNRFMKGCISCFEESGCQKKDNKF